MLQMMGDKHAVLGLVLLGTMVLLPPLGWIHHVLIVRRGCRTIFSYFHIWIARITIPLGIFNGVLGLQLSGQDAWILFTFGIVGASSWIIYMVSVIVGEHCRAKNTPEKEVEDSPVSSRRPSNAQYPPQHPLNYGREMR
jgi:hypothetical protein